MTTKKTDSNILKDFDGLFNDIPEPETAEEIEAYLIEAGYDIDTLKVEGRTILWSMT